MDASTYRRWVERYIGAWNSNDPDEIGALFAENGLYLTTPYSPPWSGREEIVRNWLDRKDEPGDTRFDFDVLIADDSIGIIKGITRYKKSSLDYHNLWEVRLDAQERCTEFVEWWIEIPKPDGKLTA